MEALTITAPAAPEAPATPESGEQTKPLKLSEAMRLGAMSTTQAIGDWGDGNSTCAIGAAQVAFGMLPGNGGPLMRLLEKAPRIVRPCQHNAGRVALVTAIIHLNDKHEWPRERIADWLETLGL